MGTRTDSEVPPASPEARAAWLDGLPLPAGLLRDGRYLYLNRAFERLSGLEPKALLGRPFEELLMPGERERLRERNRQRLRGEPVPDSYEARVDYGRGIRVVEVFVSQAGADSIFVLHDVTDRDQRQHAIRELVRLGAAVQLQHDESAIFDEAGAGLHAVEATALRLVPAEGEAVIAGAWLAPDRLASIEAALGGPLIGARRPWTEALEQTWRDGAVFLDDPAMGLVRFFGPGRGEDLRAHHARYPLTRGAMVRIDVRGKPREILALLSSWARPEDLPALQLFAAQIGAALDSAQTIGDLSRRNAELTALNRVATAAGTASNLDVLFARAAGELLALLQSDSVAFFLINPNGTQAELAHAFGGTEAMRLIFGRVPLAGTNLGKVFDQKKALVFTPDDYPASAREFLREARMQVVISAPMMVQSQVVGVVNIAFNHARKVDPAELEVVTALGVHLAAAIQSNRLVRDLRQSYEELTTAHHKLVTHERLAAVGEMGAALAHEIRNPLGVISNALASLERGRDGEDRAPELLAVIGEEVDRMNHLVHDLLIFSRPGHPDLSRTAPLGELLRESVEWVVGKTGAHVQLDLKVEDGLEAVSLDPRLMRLVFLNVAENASQAMPGGGKLEVRARALKDRRGVVEVEFRDSGAGIPSEALHRIFQPFFTTRARGTGLGLALVKRIVEGHRGEVEVHSAVGKGTTVRISWPGLAA